MSFLNSDCIKAQRFIGGISAGINISQVDGDEVYGFKKIRFNGGPMLKLHLDKDEKWSVSMEFLFSQRGAFQKNYTSDMCDTCPVEVNCNPKIKYNLNMGYIDIPVLFHYEHKKTSWTFGLGASYGRLIYYNEIKNGVKSTEFNPDFKKNDWNIIVDIRFRIFRGLKANIRYQYSIAPIRKNVSYGVNTSQSWVRNEYHNYITVRLIYMFNEKYDNLVKKTKDKIKTE